MKDLKKQIRRLDSGFNEIRRHASYLRDSVHDELDYLQGLINETQQAVAGLSAIIGTAMDYENEKERGTD